jgi:ABC-2 type transport system permease protein
VTHLLVKSIRDQRRSLTGWAIGLGGTALMYAAFYPSITRSAPDLQRYIENMPEALKTIVGGDFTSPAGYLHTELFAVLGPVLFLVFAIGAGARAIAGEEESRTLDLLLSTPLRRREILTGKAIAAAAAMAVLATTIWVVVVVVGPAFDLDVGVIDVAAACLMLVLLGIAFGSIALAVGCATGHRGLANGVAGGAAAFTYILNVLAPSVPALRWARPLSPFRWYLDPDPLLSGIRAENVAVLVAIAAVAVAVAAVTFQRRDLRA